MVSTIWSAPPESARSLPNIAPRPPAGRRCPGRCRRRCRSWWRTCVRPSPAARPTPMEPTVSARNGWIFSQVIRTTITATPASAAMISRPSPPASGTTAYVVSMHPSPSPLRAARPVAELSVSARAGSARDEDSRSTSSHGSETTPEPGSPPSIAASSRLAETPPETGTSLGSTVVSGGRAAWTITSQLSKPTTGRRRAPAARPRAARRRHRGRSGRCRRRRRRPLARRGAAAAPAAVRPQASLHSPSITSPTRRRAPAAAASPLDALPAQHGDEGGAAGPLT